MKNQRAELDDWYEAEQLHFAARDGDVKKCEELIAEGYDVHAYDAIGHTPLHYAAEHEHCEVVEFLIARGANVNAICEPLIGKPPLAHVAQTCSMKMAEMLLKAGANPTFQIGLNRSALDLAKNRKRGDGQRVYELMCRYAARTKE